MSRTVGKLRQLDRVASWFQETISHSIGSKTALIYTDRFKSQAGDLLAAKSSKNGEKAFLRVYKTFNQDILGPLICGWAVMVLRTFKQIQNKVDSKAKLWWLARDSYPGMWAAKLLSPMMGLAPEINMAVHINRLNLGIKNEIDTTKNDLISKNPEDFLNLMKYINQNIGAAKIVVIADSLQYGYMIDTLYKGKKSFIIQASNAARIWKDGRIPREVSEGFIPSGVVLLPISIYSHLCGPEFGDTVPAYLNYLAMVAGYDLTINSSIKPKLEALADAIEAIICNHKPVQTFKTIGNGQLKPDIVPINCSLAKKFTKTAKEGIINAAHKASRLIAQEDWRTFLSEQIKHLNYLLNEFEKVNQGGLSLVVRATAPTLSKRKQLFKYIMRIKKQKKDWLGIRDLTKYVFKFK